MSTSRQPPEGSSALIAEVPALTYAMLILLPTFLEASITESIREFDIAGEPTVGWESDWIFLTGLGSISEN